MVFKLSQRNAENKVCWNLNYCASDTNTHGGDSFYFGNANTYVRRSDLLRKSGH